MESLGHAGQYQEAVAVAEKALAMSGRHSWALCGLAYVYGASGNKDGATQILDEAEERSRREHMQPCLLAIAALHAGEWEKSLVYIERAESERDPLLVLLARYWPEYDPMRNDPRFSAVMDRLRLPDIARHHEIRAQADGPVTTLSRARPRRVAGGAYRVSRCEDFRAVCRNPAASFVARE